MDETEYFLNQRNDNELLDITTREDIWIVLFRQSSIGSMGEIEKIADILRALVCKQHPAKMIIDFSNVRFFSSQMLGLLVDLWRRMKEAGGKLLICGINPQLIRVFRITHLDKLFEFYENSAAAAAALQLQGIQ